MEWIRIWGYYPVPLGGKQYVGKMSAKMSAKFGRLAHE